MNVDWVAASGRARAMAGRRAGAGRARRVASHDGLASALDELDGTDYRAHLGPGPATLDRAHRATRETVLWDLRVLAGWLPARRTAVLRAVAAGFEAEDLAARARQLQDGGDLPPPFELGALGTWRPPRAATTTQELAEQVRGSPWAAAAAAPADAWGDVLTVLWWRRLVATAPVVGPWVQAAAGVLAARTLLVDPGGPDPAVAHLLGALLGTRWPRAQDLAGLREALPTRARAALAEVPEPGALWLGEVALVSRVEREGLTMLRSPRPGAAVVLGCLAVLATDAWRVRAALAAAAGGTSEVLDALA